MCLAEEEEWGGRKGGREGEREGEREEGGREGGRKENGTKREGKKPILQQWASADQFGNLRASTASSKDTLTVASCVAGVLSREGLLIFLRR